jgi:D-galactose 1-dehydrogenase
MTSPIKLAIVGVGKIVYDQHVPAIAANAAHFALVATASRNNTIDNIPSFPTIEAMLAARPDIEAVSLCMPPQYRYAAAYKALAAACSSRSRRRHAVGSGRPGPSRRSRA